MVAIWFAQKGKKERGLFPFGYSVSDSQDSYLGRSFGGVSEDEVVYRRTKQSKSPAAYEDHWCFDSYGQSHQVYGEGNVSVVVVADDSQGLEVYQLYRLDL